jgi:hypothetical protein
VNEDGSWGLSGVRPGDYRIRFTPPEPGVFQPLYYGGSKKLVSATVVTLRDADRSGLDAALITAD